MQGTSLNFVRLGNFAQSSIKTTNVIPCLLHQVSVRKNIFSSAKILRNIRTMASVQSSPRKDEEDEVEFWNRIQTHQKNAAKLSNLDEARTTIQTAKRGVLSTISQKYDNHPFGSMVGFAVDSDGRPILAISSLSPHTGDLSCEPKCSLLVSRDFNEQSEALIVVIGQAIDVPESERESVREAYLKKHPSAFWVDFGDFKFVRIEPKSVRFTANIATFAIGASVSEFSGSEYKASSPDPISEFEGPIVSHMNKDHEDAIIAMVQSAIDVSVTSAKIINVDRFGMKVEVPLRGQLSRIRLPFPRPANDRKDVKDLIVEMTKAARTKKDNN